jgi:hypothetical protein
MGGEVATQIIKLITQRNAVGARNLAKKSFSR